MLPLKIMTLDNTWKRGMGTELILLSVLLDVGVTELYVSHKSVYHNFVIYKQIFNIHDEKLTVFLTENSTGLLPNDFFKMYSPYYTVPRLARSRPFIGIACYTDASQIFNNSNNSTEFPFDKTYPIEENLKIIEFIKMAGYDVITIDSRDSDKITKAHLIKDLCECVIGYDGGIAHLCHMLEVPYFMLPWRSRQNNIPSEQLLHLDKKTFFLNNINELLSWTKEHLNQQITKLNDNQGNNKFLLGNDNETPMFNVRLDDKLFQLQFTGPEMQLLSSLYPNPVVGGAK
jgi:hypothetical protein